MSFKMENHLPDIIKSLSSNSSDIFKKLGDDIVEDVKKNTPVDTGELRKSIKAIVKDKKITIGSDLPYAAKVEFEDRSYIRKTFDEKKDNIETEMGKYLKEAMEEWS